MLRKILLIAVVLSVILLLTEGGTRPVESTPLISDPKLSTTLSGKAYDIAVRSGKPLLIPVDTYLPVLNYFGYSASGRLRGYTTLDALDEDAPQHRRLVTSEVATKSNLRLVPSGDLYVEEVSTGHILKINPDNRYVIAAAWSPSDENIIAYTFSSGSKFGISLADVSKNTSHLLRTQGILADYLSWDSSGDMVQAYITDEAKTDNAREVVIPKLRELEIPTFLLPEKGIKSLVVTPRGGTWRLPEIASDSQASNGTQSFLVKFDGGITIRGNNLLGLSSLEVLAPDGSARQQVAANLFVGKIAQGVVYKKLAPEGITINFLSTEGKIRRLAALSSTTYKLPFPASPFPAVTVTQSGEGYSGACGIFDHTFAKNMAYAYDIFAPLNSPYVLASGDGTVAYSFSDVNCNSYDTSGCSDYTGSSCSSNGGWGNAVILQHADGTFTKYAHLKYHSILPGYGSSVGIGCQIGTQGHTGATFSSSSSNPCGDHLHFQRQTTSDRGGVSTSIVFSDVPNPLSCTSYFSGNGGRSCIF